MVFYFSIGTCIGGSKVHHLLSSSLVMAEMSAAAAGGKNSLRASAWNVRGVSFGTQYQGIGAGWRER
jgi:hypothetical protein